MVTWTIWKAPKFSPFLKSQMSPQLLEWDRIQINAKNNFKKWTMIISDIEWGAMIKIKCLVQGQALKLTDRPVHSQMKFSQILKWLKGTTNLWWKETINKSRTDRAFITTQMCTFPPANRPVSMIFQTTILRFHKKSICKGLCKKFWYTNTWSVRNCKRRADSCKKRFRTQNHWRSY